MTVTTFDSRTPFRITLSVPAEVEDGEVVLTEDNFVPVGTGAVQTVFGRTGAVVAVANDYSATEVDNDSSAPGANVGAALDDLDSRVTATEGDITTLQSDVGALQAQPVAVTLGVRNIVSATAEVYRIVAPISGTIVGSDLVASATTAAGDLVVTLSIGVTPVTNGVMTIASGSAAGTVGAATPTADNVVVARTTVIIATVSGGNTAAGYGEITLLILPTV